MRVWVTRTEPGATRQAEVLVGHGFEVVKAPVLHIEHLAKTPPEGSFDVAVFVSEHAVEGACANGWRGGPAMAIGTAAHVGLQRRGHPSAWPPQENASRAADTLEGSLPRHTLVVKGEGGTDTLQRWLASRGGNVVEWDVYRRVPCEPATATESVDAIVAASGDGLRVVGKLWFAEDRDPNVPVLVPSERVSGIARSVGFANVITTAGAGLKVVVDALVRLRRTLTGALESGEETT